MRTEAGDLTGALADFDKAIELDPTDAFAYSQRALALIETGDHAAALADATRATRLHPGGAEGFCSRGLARAYLGRDRLAIADYDKAIELDPDHFQAISGRARAHMREGNAGAALADTERLVELAPDGAILYAFRAAAKAMGGNSAGATTDFDRALAMTDDPEDIGAIMELIEAASPPATEPQHIEHPGAGFAITFPPVWEYAHAAELDPSYWYDAEAVGDVEAWHEQRLSDGLLLESRAFPPFEPSMQWCSLFDDTDMAELLGWRTLAGAAAEYRRWWSDDPDNVSFETAYLDLLVSRVLFIDSRWQDGLDVREYVYTDGERWFRLWCGTYDTSPDDRWFPIAETFEFLPEEE